MDGSWFQLAVIVLLKLANVLSEVNQCQEINGKFYWMSTDKFKTDHDAQKACAEYDGILADFGQNNENYTWSKLVNFLKTEMSGIEGIWLGYHDNPWFDMSGNKLDVAQLPDRTKGEKCVIFHFKDDNTGGLFEQKHCQENHEGICVKHTLNQEQCNFQGKHYYEKNCYFETISTNAYVAEIECKNQNGTLVTLTDARQWRGLRSVLKLKNGEKIWTGITTEPRKWFSFDGNPVSWTNWDPKSQQAHSEHCVRIENDFRWKVKKCDEDKMGLCRCRKRSGFSEQPENRECSSSQKTLCITEGSEEYCYWLDTSEEKPNKLCNGRYNGQLATISDEQININLTKFFDKLKDAFIDVTDKPRLWYTSDSYLVRNADIRWENDELDSDKHCAVIKVGSVFKVSDCDRDTGLFGLCESTGNSTTDNCIRVYDKCYWRTNKIYKMKNESELDCNQGGGRLFTPPQRYDNNEGIPVIGLLNKISAFDSTMEIDMLWTGITDKVRFWYNRRDSEAQHWFNWDASQPNNGNCVIIKPKTPFKLFRWSTTKCSGSKYYPALCMKVSNSEEMDKSTLYGSSGSETIFCKSAETDTTTQPIKSTTKQIDSTKHRESTIGQTIKTTTESTTKLTDAAALDPASDKTEQNDLISPSTLENSFTDAVTQQTAQSLTEGTTEFTDATTLISEITNEHEGDTQQFTERKTRRTHMTTELADITTTKQKQPSTGGSEAQTDTTTHQSSTESSIMQADASTEPFTVTQTDTDTQPSTESSVTQTDTDTQPSTESFIAQTDTDTQPSTERSITQTDTDTQPSTESSITQTDTDTQPSTESSVTQTDITTEPLTESSVTQTDTDTQPSTESSITQTDTDAQPSTERSITQTDTDTQPSTERSITQTDTDTQPSTESSVTQTDITTEPLTESSVTHTDTTSQPAAESSVTQTDISTELLTEGPVTQTDTSTEPSTDGPVTQTDASTEQLTEGPMTQTDTSTEPLTESSITQADITTEPLTESSVTQKDTDTQPSTESYITQTDTDTQPSTESSIVQTDTDTQPSTERSITQTDTDTQPSTESSVTQTDTSTEPITESSVTQADTGTQSLPESSITQTDTDMQPSTESSVTQTDTSSQSSTESSVKLTDTTPQPPTESSVKSTDTTSQPPTESSVKSTDTTSPLPTGSSVKSTDTTSQQPTESSVKSTDTTSLPATEGSATQTDTTSQPSTEGSATQTDTSSQPSTEGSATQTDTASQPATEGSATQTDTTSQPSTEGYATQTDTTSQPPAEGSATQSDTTTQTDTPTQPSIEGSATQTDTTSQPSTESNVSQTDKTTQASTESSETTRPQTGISVKQTGTTTQTDTTTQTGTASNGTTNGPLTENSVKQTDKTTQPDTTTQINITSQPDTTSKPLTEGSATQTDTTSQPSSEGPVTQTDTTTEPSTIADIGSPQTTESTNYVDTMTQSSSERIHETTATRLTIENTTDNNMTPPTNGTDTTFQPKTESTTSDVNTTLPGAENEQTNSATKPTELLTVTTKAIPTTNMLKPIATEQKILKLCPCSCSKKNAVKNKTHLKVKVEEIKKHLTVSKTNLSSTVRKRKSSPDSRRSSETIGCIAMVLISVVSAAIIIPDVFKIVGILVRKINRSEEDEIDIE